MLMRRRGWYSCVDAAAQSVFQKWDMQLRKWSGRIGRLFFPLLQRGVTLRSIATQGGCANSITPHLMPSDVLISSASDE